MTSLTERTRIIGNINTTCRSSAALHRACRIAGVSLICWYRWRQDRAVLPDQRPECLRREPANKLRIVERRAILAACNSERFVSQRQQKHINVLCTVEKLLAINNLLLLLPFGKRLRRSPTSRS